MIVSMLLLSVAASGAGPARCEADFARFARRYVESRAYQRAHVLPRIRYSTVVDDGRTPEPRSVTHELRTSGSTTWQIKPRQRRRVQGLQVELRGVQRLRAEIFVHKPDTDWQTVYRFARRKDCWRLVEVDNQSL